MCTGGGFATRQLWTDTDEVLFDAQRPVIVTSIGDVVTRPDLLDRAVLLTLSPIDASARRTEAEVWARFEQLRPRILGAVYDAVSTALRRWPQVHLEQAPRLADFARWVVAAEPSLGLPEGAFLEAYVHNRTVATEVALEAAPVASAIRRLLDRQPTRTWAGTATQLLNELEDVVGMNVARSRGWPRNPQLLGNEVRNVEQTLREVGVTVEYERRNRERRILLARTDRPNDHQGRG